MKLLIVKAQSQSQAVLQEVAEGQIALVAGCRRHGRLTPQDVHHHTRKVGGSSHMVHTEA